MFTKIVPLTAESAEIAAAIRRITGLQDEVFAAALGRVRAGMTTTDLCHIVQEQAREQALDLSFKSVLGFPAEAAVGVRGTVINGVPGASTVGQGDIVRFSFGTQHERKAFSVLNWSFAVGRASPAAQQLFASCKATLDDAMRLCVPGTRYSALAKALGESAERHQFHLSSDYAGHQIGRAPVMEPAIALPRGLVRRDAELVPGVFLSLFVLGHAATPHLQQADNGWTMKDRNAELSALFSLVVEVTGDGPRLVSREHPTVVAG